jgi:hypothetical protein
VPTIRLTCARCAGTFITDPDLARDACVHCGEVVAPALARARRVRFPAEVEAFTLPPTEPPYEYVHPDADGWTTLPAGVRVHLELTDVEGPLRFERVGPLDVVSAAWCALTAENRLPFLGGVENIAVSAADDAALALLEEAVEARNVIVRGDRFSDGALARMLARMPRLVHLEVLGSDAADGTRLTSAFLAGASLPDLRYSWFRRLRVGAGFGAAIATAAPGLEALTLADCDLDVDDAAAIATLPHLETLHLTDQGLGRLLPVFATAPALRHLHLDASGATDADLAPLAGHPRLEWLSLRSTRITDAVCATLETLPALTRVYLTSTAVTVAAVDALRTLRPSLRVTHW